MSRLNDWGREAEEYRSLDVAAQAEAEGRVCARCVYALAVGDKDGRCTAGRGEFNWRGTCRSWKFWNEPPTPRKERRK